MCLLARAFLNHCLVYICHTITDKCLVYIVLCFGHWVIVSWSSVTEKKRKRDCDEFEVGDKVQAKWIEKGKSTWLEAKVVKKGKILGSFFQSLLCRLSILIFCLSNIRLL